MTGDLTRLNQVSTRAAALAYAARGWPVMPVAGMAGRVCGCREGADCSHPGKHPLCRGGVTAASTEAGQIRRWWARWPRAGVGIATGVRSRLVVVDVDPGHDGERSLARLALAGFALPDTLTARTGGGGRHLLFVRPDRVVGNTAGRLPGAGPAPGVDVRGDGGYIVAPPSQHRSGRHYQWLEGTAQPVPFPGWSAERTVDDVDRHVAVDRLSGYAAAALENEVRDVSTAPVGQRNDTLNRAAFSLGTLVGAGCLDVDDARDALRVAAEAVGIPGREAERTIRSGLSAGQLHPRQLDDRGGNRRSGPPPAEVAAANLSVAGYPTGPRRSRSLEPTPTRSPRLRQPEAGRERD